MRSIPKFLLVVFLILSLPSIFFVSASPNSQQVAFTAPRLIVNTSFLNVRSGPGIQYNILLTVVGGTELPVLGRSGDNVWYQVSTVIGVGWANVEYTVPRGSFDNVPVVSFDPVAAPIQGVGAVTLALPGQGGGGITTSSSPIAPALGGITRFTLPDNRVITVQRGERFRAAINVEAVNLRTQPADNAPVITILFRDTVIDYTLVDSRKDSNSVEWIAIDVPDVGVGWIEAPKVIYRLSRASGQVLVLVSQVQLTNGPGGGGDGLPLLSNGQEMYLLAISRDGRFLQVELPDGLRGWVPWDSTLARGGTATDLVDLSTLQSVPTAPDAMATPNQSGGGAVSFGLDTPHIVVNTGFLNIRSGPGAQFTSITTVPGGTEIAVIGIAPDAVWYLVRGSFGQGWVNSEFTIFRGVIDNVPIIRATVGTLSSPVAIVAGQVTLYVAPGTSFGIVGTIGGPSQADIVARTADLQWVQINTNLGFGWVQASQITITGDIGAAPIVG
jgi:uncharacterized protein YgiM (DUF1202 family)